MKKHLLTLSLLLLTFINVKAQTNLYHPFPDSNAVWSEHFTENSCYCPTPSPPMPCSYSCGDYSKKFINGDTVVGAFTYHKVYVARSHYQYNGVFPAPLEFNMGIRQDSSTKKVYMFSIFVSDTLLYDFNLQAGDTLPPTYINSPGDHNYVSSMDSVLIGPNYRKRYHINSYDFPGNPSYIYLIEGIGSTFGLAERMFLPLSTRNTLNCFSQNGTTLYIDSTSSGDCYLALEEKTINKNPGIYLKVSPNPFASSTSITTNSKECTLVIYNTFGQVLKTIPVTDQAITLQRENLPNGIYFIRLSKDKRVLATTKFIVADN